MKKHFFFKSFILLLIFFIFNSFSKSQDAKFKALFIFNFTKYIKWEKDKEKEEFFKILILGNTVVSEELSSIAGRIKVAGHQKIKIENISKAEEITNCHILYLANNKTKLFQKALKKLEGKNTLFVTDKKNLVMQGSGISFFKEKEKLRFQISTKNIKKKRLKVAAALTRLGIKID